MSPLWERPLWVCGRIPRTCLLMPIGTMTLIMQTGTTRQQRYVGGPLHDHVAGGMARIGPKGHACLIAVLGHMHAFAASVRGESSPREGPGLEQRALVAAGSMLIRTRPFLRCAHCFRTADSWACARARCTRRLCARTLRGAATSATTLGSRGHRRLDTR